MAIDEPSNIFNRPCRLILARHGQTEWNKEWKFQGHTNTNLTETGKLQAALLAKRLENWNFDVVYSSPLERALFTAKEITKSRNFEPIILPELQEINFGSWEGQSIHSLENNNNEIFSRWRADPFFNPPEGAETWQQISDRLSKAINFVLSSNHKNIILVSHGGIIRALHAVLLGFNPHKTWNIDVSNCSITGIEIRNGRACLAFSNDDLHIRAKINDFKNLPVWGEF